MLGRLGSTLNNAWHFIQSGVVSGISSAPEIARTISEGLGLDYEDVLSGVETYQQIEQGYTRLQDLPDFYKVSSEFAASTNFDYQEKYIMKMKVYGKDANTGESIESWVTVESATGTDENGFRLTKEKWFNMAQEGVLDSAFGYSWELEYASDFEYYIREEY